VIGGNSVNTFINLPTGAANTDAELSNAAAAGSMQITGSTFEDTTFPNPTGSLTITINHAGDLLTVSSFDAAFAVPLTIQGVGSTTMTATDITWTGTIGISGTFTAAPASGTQTLSGLITGTTIFSKSGAGTAIITAGNNFFGSTTTVLEGTLLVTNPSGSATGATNVSVSAGATFGGSGSIMGSVNASGSVNPGQ
jgi:autotransporter-associated beta strand protein